MQADALKKTLILFVLAIASGCGHPEPTRYQIFGIGKFRQIRDNPKRYAGKIYAFGGGAVNTEQTPEKVSFQLLVQNRLSNIGEEVPSDGPLLVVYPAPNTTVADGHEVKVLGFVREPDVGENVFGVTISSFRLDAIALYDSFTQYPFWLPGYEAHFEKWKTGEPLAAKD
jgi:hypothetical protein